MKRPLQSLVDANSANSLLGYAGMYFNALNHDSMNALSPELGPQRQRALGGAVVDMRDSSIVRATSRVNDQLDQLGSQIAVLTVVHFLVGTLTAGYCTAVESLKT